MVRGSLAFLELWRLVAAAAWAVFRFLYSCLSGGFDNLVELALKAVFLHKIEAFLTLVAVALPVAAPPRRAPARALHEVTVPRITTTVALPVAAPPRRAPARTLQEVTVPRITTTVALPVAAPPRRAPARALQEVTVPRITTTVAQRATSFKYALHSNASS
jgi:hypothetical protein